MQHWHGQLQCIYLLVDPWLPAGQIMELEQKLQDTTRQFAKLQASETDLQDRLKQEARASEASPPCCWF